MKTQLFHYFIITLYLVVCLFSMSVFFVTIEDVVYYQSPTPTSTLTSTPTRTPTATITRTPAWWDRYDRTPLPTLIPRENSAPIQP